MKEMMNETTTITFYPLAFFQEDEGDVTIGRVATDAYALFPQDGARLLQQLQTGLSPAKASHWYEQTFGEEIDIADFLQQVQELGFICSERECEKQRSSSRDAFWYWSGKIAFSWYAFVLYGILFLASLYEMILLPVLRPSYQNIFFSQSFVLLECGLLAGQIPCILLHELAHMLAGRRLGIPATLRLGYRLNFLVIETRLTGLWSVPRRVRYLPFLAGMLTDGLCFSLLTILAGRTIDHSGKLSFFGSFCLALAFSTLMRFLWQFYLYLRTDLYYVFTHACGCIDLHRTTQASLQNFFWRIVRRMDKIEDESTWYPKDRQVVHWYAPLYLLGNLLSLSIFLLVGVPALWRLASTAIVHLQSNTFSPLFWDACLFLTYNLSQLCIVVILFLRDHRRKRTKRLSQNHISKQEEPEVRFTR